MSIDLTLDSETNDLVLTQGRLTTVTGGDLKGQKIRNRLLTAKGELPYDTDFGLDYFGIIWVKQMPEVVKIAHIKATILESADIGDRITAFEYSLDSQTRELTVSATVESVATGESISVSV